MKRLGEIYSRCGLIVRNVWGGAESAPPPPPAFLGLTYFPIYSRTDLLRARRALRLLNTVQLKPGMGYIWLYKVYDVYALLVLNGASCNSGNALLVLSQLLTASDRLRFHTLPSSCIYANMQEKTGITKILFFFTPVYTCLTPVHIE